MRFHKTLTIVTWRVLTHRAGTNEPDGNTGLLKSVSILIYVRDSLAFGQFRVPMFGIVRDTVLLRNS